MPNIDQLTATIQHIYRLLGPNTCECVGCQTEIDAALKVIRESGVDLSEIDEQIERQQKRRKAEALVHRAMEASSRFRNWLALNPRPKF